MNQPGLMTRFIGTPRVAAVFYVGFGLLVVGWAGDAVPWWLALIALCVAGAVPKAVKDVRAYNQWYAAWAAMGSPAGRMATTQPQIRKRMRSSPWARLVLAAVSLVVIPAFIAAPETDEGLRQALTVLWCAAALYLAWRLAAKLYRTVARRSRSVSAGKVTAGAKDDASNVVAWMLPPAASSPSRADAVLNLPDYCARLLA